MYSREEVKILKRNFWTGFDAFCAELPRFKIRKRKWILYNTKIKGVELKFDAARDGAYVIFELNHPKTSKRLEMFELMKKYKVVVDQYFADAEWQEQFEKPCGTLVSRIYRHLGGLDIHRQEQWPEFYPFLSREMCHCERMFKEMRELLQDCVESKEPMTDGE
ncbi:MAG: DUF4268 domain-containing protein [Paludibacteraceae bacterium]|nr:DUF4268 domain-containing protein [Paludibacteraceae bacterium]MBR4814024.1 DUF4268 domain-containing protein [Paludibacteraceae bacterium]